MAEGTVVELRENPTNVDGGGKEYTPVVEFRTDHGLYRHHSSTYKFPTPYHLGQKVKIYYYIYKSRYEFALEDDEPGTLPDRLKWWGIIFVSLVYRFCYIKYLSSSNIRQVLIMPRIILTMPFLFHYAGSVFDLSDRIGVLNWDPDERVREKLSYQNNRYFELPDNGKGQETKLPLNYTIFCPENLLSEMDLNSGPCRITSVSKELEAEEDPWYASDVPKGRGKVLMNDSELYRNNLLL